MVEEEVLIKRVEEKKEIGVVFGKEVVILEEAVALMIEDVAVSGVEETTEVVEMIEGGVDLEEVVVIEVDLGEVVIEEDSEEAVEAVIEEEAEVVIEEESAVVAVIEEKAVEVASVIKELCHLLIMEHHGNHREMVASPPLKEVGANDEMEEDVEWAVTVEEVATVVEEAIVEVIKEVLKILEEILETNFSDVCILTIQNLITVILKHTLFHFSLKTTKSRYI